GRERVDGHPLEPDLECALDGVEERLLTGRVTVGALEAPALGPTAVAVHHDRNVSGHAAGVEIVHGAQPTSRYRPGRMRWTAVVNPSAGRGRTRRMLPTLTSELTGTGADVDVRVAADVDETASIAREAFAQDRGV